MDEWELKLRPVRRMADSSHGADEVAEPNFAAQMLAAVDELRHAIDRIGFRLEAIEGALGLKADLEDRPLAEGATRAMRRFAEARARRAQGEPPSPTATAPTNEGLPPGSE